jgi:hypothetical protein
MVSRNKEPGKSPAMPWYGKDFYDDEHVKLMSLEQEGAYQRLLWHAWSHGSIPADVESLAKLFGVPKARAVKLWPGIAPCWTEVDGRLRQKRLDRVRGDQREHSEEMRRLALRRYGKEPPSDAGPHATPHAQSQDGNDAKADAQPHALSQCSPSPKEGRKEGSLSGLSQKTVLEIAQDLARAEAADG